MKFDSLGENAPAAAFVFQWQEAAKFVQVLPGGASATIIDTRSRPGGGRPDQLLTRPC